MKFFRAPNPPAPARAARDWLVLEGAAQARNLPPGHRRALTTSLCTPPHKHGARVSKETCAQGARDAIEPLRAVVREYSRLCRGNQFVYTRALRWKQHPVPQENVGFPRRNAMYY